MKIITLDRPATKSNFNEEEYLFANPDVKAAIDQGILSSGAEHFDNFGINEHRLMRVLPRSYIQIKNDKLNRVRSILKSNTRFSSSVSGALNFLSPSLKKKYNIIDTEAVSAHGYNQEVENLIKRHSSGLLLDCGAGRRPKYYSNVVNFEIVDYDTTDVVGVGEELPFIDNCFDAVISIAVLEHVKDPFLCAQEISRVLKPGGTLYCSVPFLQPEHGYPHHYYNMTKMGLTNLFDNLLKVEDVYVHPSLHPIFSLNWILTEWANHLPEKQKKEFSSLSVSDLLKNPADSLSEDWASKLEKKTHSVLASGHVLVALKK